MATREESLYLAKIAEQTQRYHEMLEYMDEVVIMAAEQTTDLTVEERNLLSTAYKKVMGSLRDSRWVLSKIEQHKGCRTKYVNQAEIEKEYRINVENEIAGVCDRILMMLNKYLIPLACSSGSIVFYLKMKGDFLRYLAESKSGDDRNWVVDRAMHTYKAAEEIALDELIPTDPVRLGLALNMSVFYYEILNQREKARSMAKFGLQEANKLYSLDPQSHENSAAIMKIIAENLNLWDLED